MDGQTLYGTDQKIEPENYKIRNYLISMRVNLKKNKFTFTIKNLSKNQYDLLIDLLNNPAIQEVMDNTWLDLVFLYPI